MLRSWTTRGWVALLIAALFVLRPALALASPEGDLKGANQLVLQAVSAAQHGDLTVAKAHFEQFRQRWLDVEDGVKSQSVTAYRAIEDEMAAVQFALLQTPPDRARVTTSLQALAAANEKFINGGFPAGAGQQPAATGSVADLIALLDQAKARIQAGDATGAAKAMDQFRQSWLGVEGVVLTESGKVYADAERDMVDAAAMLAARPPNLSGALVTVERMRGYLEPIAGKSSYSAFDAATILLREGLEALLVIVALLGYLKKAGHANKSGWIWAGVGAGLAVSAALAAVVKLVFGVGTFGSNNFLIVGWTGLFAAVMLIWVSYWLHSKSSAAEWQSYIRKQSTAALATGSLLSLAALSFLAVFREGTETVLFYVGMASSISTSNLLLGLGLGAGFLLLIAFIILKVGVRIPMRPFFLVSSVLVFYLGFKFTGMGIHGLQLAGVLPTTLAPYLPSIDFLALYPNWQSTLPQLVLLVLAVWMAVRQRRRAQVVEP